MEAAKLAYEEASKAYHELVRKRDRASHDAAAPFFKLAREAAEKASAKYNQRILDAHTLKESRAKERDRLSVETSEARHGKEVGKRFTRWRYKYGRWAKAERDSTGVLAIWTGKSYYPDGMADHLHPKPGDAYIRLLKKDGSESKKFSVIGRRYGWFPEGEDPNDKRKR